MISRRVAVVFVALCAAFLLLPVGGCEETITADNYDLIQTGMTKAEVEAILGEGVQDTTTGISISGGGVASGGNRGASNVATYVWRKNRKEISVTFQDGKVMTKGKAGI